MLRYSINCKIRLNEFPRKLESISNLSISCRIELRARELNLQMYFVEMQINPKKLLDS